MRYDIDFKGNVVDAKILAGLGHGCDEEALRLVKLLKFDVQKTRGLRVLYHKNIQIHFRLPKAVKAPAPTVVQYQITAATKAAESHGSASGSYTYSVEIG